METATAQIIGQERSALDVEINNCASKLSSAIGVLLVTVEAQGDNFYADALHGALELLQQARDHVDAIERAARK